MHKIQFDINAANGVAIEVANDILSVWWMEVLVYPFRLKQLHHCNMPKLNDLRIIFPQELKSSKSFILHVQ